MPAVITTALVATSADRQAYWGIWTRYQQSLAAGRTIIIPPDTPSPADYERWALTFFDAVPTAIANFMYRGLQGIEIIVIGIVDPPLIAGTTNTQRNTVRTQQMSTLLRPMWTAAPAGLADRLFGYVTAADAQLQTYLQATKKGISSAQWVTQPDGTVLYSGKITDALAFFP